MPNKLVFALNVSSDEILYGKGNGEFSEKVCALAKKMPRGKTKVSRRNNQKLYKVNANVNRLFEENQKGGFFYIVFSCFRAARIYYSSEISFSHFSSITEKSVALI